MENIPNKELARIEEKASLLTTDLNKAVDWANKFLNGAVQQRVSNKIKKIRRDIKKIKFAIPQKPSSALYGESQVGKSYLIKNLLSKPGEPFNVKDKSSSSVYDFLEHINPKGDGVEATSIVTRFSTHVDTPNSNYPIMVRLLSPKDIVLLLCDTYFADVIDHQFIPNASTVEKHIQDIETKFTNTAQQQEAFTEDDVYDIKEYFEEHFKSFTSDIINSKFWQVAASFIEHVDYRNWLDIFKILWSNNEFIGNIFTRLIDALRQVHFSSIVYIEFRAVLRKHGTLLHVARLRELTGEPTFEDVSNANYLKNVDMLYQSQQDWIPNSMDKSILCALVAELVIEVDGELESSKPFLKHSDLLDFPGARSRMKNQESKLSEAHIGNMVLRGKVSYIFNKYSSQYLISNLLFCNKNTKIEVTYIPKLLNSWIENYIGEDETKRSEFLEGSDISPLFIIYTFFNEDMTFDPINDKEDNLSEKWVKRFKTIFENEILTKTYDWHQNWVNDKKSKCFKNNYLLRDFHYSKTVYAGYDENERESEAVPVKMNNYLDKLKKSFIDFDFVQNHFENPEKSWNEAASMNKDGSDLIIFNLAKVSNNYARTQKFIRMLNELSLELNEEMRKHYHSDDSDKQIKKAAKKAGDIHGNIDNVFGRDPYAFGTFINAFVVRESTVYNFYKDELRRVELIEKSNITSYVLIRNSNPELGIKKSFDENVSVLMKTYYLENKEGVEQYFLEKGINLNELFYGEVNSLKNNSLILAEGLRDFWFSNYLHRERFEYILQFGFSEVALENLFENIKLTFNELEVTESIAENIREYVDRFDKIEEAEEMIADISATIINKFITSMGWDFYSDSKMADLKATNEANNLNLNLKSRDENLELMDNAEIATLFDNMHKYNEIVSRVSLDQNVVKDFPNISNISKWRDRMIISFIANCAIPTYDVLANQELGKILQFTEQYQFKLNETALLDTA
ncbi:MAG: virulence factor SrfC family protein [Saprospiraceae bacterium]